MAHPIGFPQANLILNRPKGMSAEECSSLEVYRDSEHVVSRWQLTDEDIAELKRNGNKIWIWMWARAVPPIAISAETPFEARDGDEGEDTQDH